MPKRLPKGFRYGFDDAVACPHRDVTCCDTCRGAHEELVAVREFTYWVTDPDHRAEMREREATEAQRVALRETRR